MTEQQTLVEFLEARLKDDQEAAELMAKYYPPPWEVYDRGWMARVYGDYPFWEVTRLEQGPWVDNDTPPHGEIIEHVALHDPGRVLREVNAKRAILELADEASGLDQSVDLDRRVGPRDCKEEPFIGDLIVKQLAAAYSDHESYREEWRP